MPNYDYWKIAAANTPNALWDAVDFELESRRKKFPEALQRLGKHCVLYGAGRFASDVLRAWRLSGITPAYVVDGDPKKWGKSINGLAIYKPDKLRTEEKDCLVIIASMVTSDIENYLNIIGLPYLFAERDGSIDNIPGHKLTARRADFDRVFYALADQKSKETLMAVAKARMFQRFYFPMRGNVFTYEVACYPQYFPKDIVKMCSSEYFVDCGTFDGDTIVSFFSEARNSYPGGCFKAVGFEVDPSNIRNTVETLEHFGLESVEIIPSAVGAMENSVSLTEFHTCRDSYRQQNNVKVTTLDRALTGVLPTLIKMDIEGYELDALQGAFEIISSAKPRLAVCSYHETEHLLDVPLHLIDLPSESEIFMRHHSAGTLWETVCYRIPK